LNPKLRLRFVFIVASRGILDLPAAMGFASFSQDHYNQNAETIVLTDRRFHALAS
jgi:hypothetical protein